MPIIRKHAILITGATSALGQQLVKQLYFDKGVGFVLATAMAPMPYYFEQYSPQRFAYTRMNLTKGREVSNLFYSDLFLDNEIDTVIHLAFNARPNDRNPVASHKLNIDATRMLLDYSEKNDKITKFIFRSSHQVYRLSPGNSVYLDEDSDLNFETTANQWIKDRVDADMLCRAKMGANNLDVIVLRFSNLMGMNVNSQLHWLLNSTVANVPQGFNPMINLLHVKDAVRSFQLAVHKKISGVFNIVGRDTAPLSRIIELNGTRVIPVPGPFLRSINKLKRTIGATNYHMGVHGDRLRFSCLLDPQRAKKRLGYEPVNHVELG